MESPNPHIIKCGTAFNMVKLKYCSVKAFGRSVTWHWPPVCHCLLVVCVPKMFFFFFFPEHTECQAFSWLPVPSQVTVYASPATHRNIPTRLTGFCKARGDLHPRVVFALLTSSAGSLMPTCSALSAGTGLPSKILGHDGYQK